MKPKLKLVQRDPHSRAAYNFSRYVQRIAFDLSLTKPMIDGLMLVRDFGTAPVKTESNAKMDLFKRYGVYGRWIAVMASLERRGMVWHDVGAKRAWKLTEIGELTVRMCVIAGLMPENKVEV